ncbi:hypothetical protein Ddc_23075 [Ditylenchus destructor]|nr:hypothetical protein Ddc_23075 [Ditylenchus destructor]
MLDGLVVPDLPGGAVVGGALAVAQTDVPVRGGAQRVVVFLDAADAHAQVLGDARLIPSLELREQKGLTRLGAQAVQHLVEREQRLDDERVVLGRGVELQRKRRELFEIGAFQVLPAEVVNQQTAGDGREIGARLRDGGRLVAGLEQAKKGVVGEVGGAVGALAQTTAQPLRQPGAVLPVQTFMRELHSLLPLGLAAARVPQNDVDDEKRRPEG